MTNFVSHVVIAAYAVRLAPELVKLDAETLTPPKTHKKPETIAEWRASKAEELDAVSLSQPLTSTLSHVMFSHNRRVIEFEETAGQPPVSTQAGQWLMKTFPDGWPEHTRGGLVGESQPPSVCILGFDPRLLVKIIGLESAMESRRAEGATRMPLSFWYGSAAYRDVVPMLLPADCKYLELMDVLRAIGFGKLLRDLKWTKPGQSLLSDIAIVTAICHRLGVLHPEEM